MALGFRDIEALQVVLASGMCPPDVQARPIKVARTGDGGVIVEPDKPLANLVINALKKAGVTVDAALPLDARVVRCWAEAIPPAKVAIPEIPSLVLLVSEDTHGLIDLAAELVRLGCERQELLVTDRLGVARVVDPPTYTIVRALDRDRGLRVYAPDPVGQETVWTELGYRHALAGRLKAEPKSLLLVSADAWRTIPDDGWRGLDAALELAVPGEVKPYAPTKFTTRRKIELRLSQGRRDAASLWVLRRGGVAAIDKLLEYLPEDVVGRLMFAASASATDDAEPLVIVRARTGRHAAPELALADAEVYAPLAQMPDVYAPAGAIVEPPLRRERLRQVLNVGTNEIMWLAPIAGDARGRFRTERIAETAFVPLGEWAEYVIHASVAEIVPWMRAAEFDFAPFVSSGREWAEAPDDAEEEKKKAKRKVSEPRRARTGAQAAAELPATYTPRTPQAAAPATTKIAAEVDVADVVVDQELAALEAEFVALDAAGDAPERLVLLDRLARSYARLGRRRDAGLCFSRAVWEAPAAEVGARLDTWIAADLRAAGDKTAAAAIERVLGEIEPATDDIRLVAAIAARAGAPVQKDPHRLVRWLDDHDAELDARATWLARVGLANLAGGDALALAHARDRILARLAGGLPVERELPAFLRFGGRSGALGNASGEHLTKALEELASRIAKVKRKRSPVEANPTLTTAYVAFLLAHGFARIGKQERARELVNEAKKTLDPLAAADAVHHYLATAYAARVDQAIAGMPAEAPLPDAIGAELAGLDRVARYKVDRLREASRILEPLERPDAIGAFSKKQADARGPEFAALRAIVDAGQRAKEIEKLIATARADQAERERLIDGVLDVLLELPEASAVPLLAGAWPLIAEIAEAKQAVLYAEALVVAGHFGRMELVPELLELLGRAIPAVAGADLAKVLDKGLRALRRIGLRNEIAELLARAEAAIPVARADALIARLALAGGLSFLGEYARAVPTFEAAREALVGTPTMQVRLEITRALAHAYSQAPLAQALGGIAELTNQLKDISDSYGTNSHYCLSVLHFVESLVVGVTSDDLALGEAGRRFVEDDEHLIRRRLHRDLGGSA